MCAILMAILQINLGQLVIPFLSIVTGQAKTSQVRLDTIPQRLP